MVDPHYTDGHVTLYHGDCLDVLRDLPDGSVDSVVTDPPYDLTAGKKGGTGLASVNLNSPAGRARITAGFMGKAWDGTGIAFTVELWTECLRVLKPGGMMLSFGGTRTYHRLACAIEDAGFEIRDSISWLYGSGFAKSLQPYRKLMPCPLTERVPHVVRLSEWHPLASPAVKAPTALALAETQPEGDVRVLIRTGAADGSHALTVTSLSDWTMGGMTWNTVSSCNGYSVDNWQPKNMSITETMIEAITDPRTSRSCTSLLTAISTLPPATQADGCECDAAIAATRSSDGSWKLNGTRTPTAQERVIAPLAPLRGLGTATKPAHEPIVVARKPLVGTVSQNVLAHGTGALNVDASRVGEADGFGGGAKASSGFVSGYESDGFVASTKGRWPPNVLLDESQAAALDRQSGNRPGAVSNGSKGTTGSNGIYNEGWGSMEQRPGRGDSGGASRFFPTFRYEAKAPTLERPRDGQTAHPTVKPLDLMRWLVRLVTPPGGTCLDPFAGSGTTAEACIVEGFRCIAVEREPDYLPLIVARLSKPIQPDMFGGVAHG